MAPPFPPSRGLQATAYGNAVAGSAGGAITLQLRDKWGNAAAPVGVLSVAGTTLLGSASRQLASLAGASRVAGAPIGQYLLSYSATTADTYQLALYIGDGHSTATSGTALAPLANGSVVVTASAISLASTRVACAALSSGGQAGVSFTLSAVPFDAYGNPNPVMVGYGPTRFNLSVAPSGRLSSADQASGVTIFSFTPMQVGAAVLTLIDSLTKSSFWSATIVVRAGPTSAAFSSLSGAGLYGTMSGKASSFVITAADAFGNPTGRGGDLFDLVITSSSGALDADAAAAAWELTEVTGADGFTPSGAYKVTYNLTISDAAAAVKTFNLSVTLGGGHVGTLTAGASSPIAVVVRKLVGLISAPQSKVAGLDQLATTAAGTRTQISIMAVDASGMPLTSGGSAFSVTLDGVTASGLSLLDDGAGGYALSWVLPNSAGAHTLSVYLQDVPLPAQGKLLSAYFPLAFQVAPGPPSAARSSLAVASGLDSSESVVAGATFAYRLILADSFGNALAPSALPSGGLAVSGFGADAATGSRVACQAFGALSGRQACALGTSLNVTLGAWTALGRMITAGNYTISASISGGLVSGEARAVRVVADAIVSVRSRVSGDALRTAAGAPLTLTCDALDAWGNVVPPVIITKATLYLNASSFGLAVGPGGLTAQYALTQSGFYLAVVSVVSGAAVVNTSLFSLAVAPAAADLAQSRIDVPPGVFASQDFAVVIAARDAYGNPLSVGGSAFGVALRNMRVPTFSMMDMGNGTYVASIAGIPASGNYTVDVRLLNFAVRPFPVTVAPQRTSAPLSGLSTALGASFGASQNIVAGTAGAQFWIRPVDARGVSQIGPSGLAKVTDTFAASLTGVCASNATGHGPSRATIGAFTLSAGYSLQLFGVAAGPCTLAVSLAGVPISGSPFNLTVVPGPAALVAVSDGGAALAFYTVWGSGLDVSAVVAAVIPGYADWLAADTPALAEAFFGLSLSDAFGNALPADAAGSSAPPHVGAITGRSDPGFQASLYSQLDDGRWIASLRTTLAGLVTGVHFIDADSGARLNAAPLPQVTLLPGPLEIARLAASGAGLDADATAGVPAVINVTGSDKFGNPRPFSPDDGVTLGLSLRLQVRPCHSGRSPPPPLILPPTSALSRGHGYCAFASLPFL